MCMYTLQPIRLVRRRLAELGLLHQPDADEVLYFRRHGFGIHVVIRSRGVWEQGHHENTH
jgi:hypothetical protein